jgi:hypothetical protein
MDLLFCWCAGQDGADRSARIGSLVKNEIHYFILLLAANSRTLKGSDPALAYRGNQKQVSKGHLFLIAGAQYGTSFERF